MDYGLPCYDSDVFFGGGSVYLRVTRCEIIGAYAGTFVLVPTLSILFEHEAIQSTRSYRRYYGRSTVLKFERTKKKIR